MGILGRLWPALAAIVVAAGIFGAAVWTSLGQLVDQLILDLVRSLGPITPVPTVLTPEFVDYPALWLAVGVVVISLVAVGLRTRPSGRQLWCFAALLAFPPVSIVAAQTLRDHVLSRPVLHEWITETTNSAPSGHAAAVTAMAAVLVLATPPRFRTWMLVASGSWAAAIEFGLIAAGWHRLSDVLISTILVAGAATLLPDPHRHAKPIRAAGWMTLLPFVIPFAAVLFTAVYYPSLVALGAALVIGFVVMACLTGFLRQIERRYRAEPDAPVKETLAERTPVAA